MSKHANTILLEEAAFYIDVFEGKLPAQLMETDIANNDLEELAVHVKQARDMAFQQEYQPSLGEHYRVIAEGTILDREQTDVA